MSGSAGGNDFNEGVAGARFHPVAAPNAAAASSLAHISGAAGTRAAVATLRRPNLVVVIVTAARNLGRANILQRHRFIAVKRRGLAFRRTIP
jgi:hypothetical protein